MESNNLITKEEDYIKLDYTLEDSAERVALVEKILATTPPEKLTNQYISKLGDYILKIEKKDKTREIVTKNRKVTLSEREISLEGFSAKLNTAGDDNNLQEEDLIYNLVINDKNVFLTSRYKKITQEDIDAIPELKPVNDAIIALKEKFQTAKGKARYSIKQNIKELYKDLYVIRSSRQKVINCINVTKSASRLDLYENVTIKPDGELKVDANISLLDPRHVSMALCNYSKLKEDSYGKFESDIYYFMLDLEDVVIRALENYPMYYDLLVYKIDGLKNEDIQKEIAASFGVRFSVEYISSLWRNKIPKLIAEQAQKEWLEWYYTEKEVGYWKRCSRCGQIKLGHNKFFSKNKTSKDGWYSICKDCRNKKVGTVKEL